MVLCVIIAALNTGPWNAEGGITMKFSKYNHPRRKARPRKLPFPMSRDTDEEWNAFFYANAPENISAIIAEQQKNEGGKR